MKAGLPFLAIVGLLFAYPDVPQLYRLRPPAMLSEPAASLPAIPVLPDVFLAVVQDSSGTKSSLQPESRLAIIRYVDGEFVRVLKPLPAWKKGFKVQVGRPVDEKELHQLLVKHGAAANPGDTVQITRIEFKERQIIVDINGGSRKRFRLRDHLQIGIGSPYPTVTTTTVSDRPAIQPRGATLILDYGRALPDMSPDDLKHALSIFLDFSKGRSAAVNWVESLSPQFRDAIQQRKAVVGMDRDMVLAALGRPEHKVRERNPDGVETEDWIYGNPPARTIFVTFEGDRVVRVKEFN